jgi:hypothetical protein
MKNPVVKNYAALAALICAVLPLLGCGTIVKQIMTLSVVYDESLPKEETALVVFSEAIRVVEYNGIAVEDTWYPDKKLRRNKATLPAGETSIVFNYRGSINAGNTRISFHGEGIELHFDFEAGKEYTMGMYTQSLGFFQPTEYGVAIWDASGGSAFRKDKLIKSWRFGDF